MSETNENTFVNLPDNYREALLPVDVALRDISFYVDYNMSKNDNACHVYFYKQKAFTLTLGAKVSHIVFADLDLPFEITTLSSEIAYPGEDKPPRVYIDMMFNWDALRDAVKKLAARKRSTVSVDRFGCCNDFNRCSDAQACIHPDDYFYLGCEYRRNLEAGRIFYGKNRNIFNY